MNITIRHWGLIGGLLFFALVMNLPVPEGLSLKGLHVLAIALWMICWWLSEAVPIPVTAMVPLVAFPLLGISNFHDVALHYAGEAIFLALGGFVLGMGLERWNLHLRFALHLLKRAGSSPSHIVGGFMIACAFVSMWISNTASTIIMLPIAASITALVMSERQGTEKEHHNFGMALMLGLAYSASIGGMMTLVGTGTNVMFKGYMEDVFGLKIGFLQWMKIGVPIGLVLLFATWLLLCFVLFPTENRKHSGVREIIDDKLRELGRMSHNEELVAMIFVLTVGLWFAQDKLNELVPMVDFNSASIAMLGALLLFVVPSDWKKGEMLLNWKATKELPWGILLLLGGGLALAKMISDHGVADWMGTNLHGLGDVSTLTLLLITIVAMVFLTEFMSNIATLTSILPVVTSVAIGFGENPLLLAVPMALAASCAFMLPISTPPNAVVFSTNMITVAQMARTGIWLNLIAIAVLTLATYFLLPLVFDIQPDILPEWAKH